MLFPSPENGLRTTIFGLNRPPRGYGRPRVKDSRLLGGPKVHFEAKHLEFRFIFLQFSRIFGSVALGNPEISHLRAKGNHSLSTWSLASNLLGFPADLPASPVGSAVDFGRYFTVIFP